MFILNQLKHCSCYFTVSKYRYSVFSVLFKAKRYLFKTPDASVTLWLNIFCSPLKNYVKLRHSLQVHFVTVFAICAVWHTLSSPTFPSATATAAQRQQERGGASGVPLSAVAGRRGARSVTAGAGRGFQRGRPQLRGERAQPAGKSSPASRLVPTLTKFAHVHTHARRRNWSAPHLKWKHILIAV